MRYVVIGLVTISIQLSLITWQLGRILDTLQAVTP